MTISVVIPAYNEADHIAACLDSLAAQTRPADEIIVVDNNSSDATAAIASQYDVTVIAEPVQGIMPAVFSGFTACSGCIIARCDADSILPPEWLATIESTLELQPWAAGVTGPGSFYDTGRFRAAAAQVWYMYAYFLLVGAALANWPLFGSNCALRREAWEATRERIHKTRIDIHDDMDFSIHIKPTDRIVFKPAMKVGISARSLKAAGLKARYRKGFTSLLIHWPADAPWSRWRIKLGNKQ